ncbi:MAG: phage minor head protein [Patescibacteria group bacterium]
MVEAVWGNLSFEEAMDYFRRKLNIPTEQWDTLMRDQQVRAFSVAGVTSDAILADLRREIDRAIAEGLTIDSFRATLADVVKKTGWDVGAAGVGYRARIIFNTNLANAYSAGRWVQQTSPAVRAVRPFLRYIPSVSKDPRPEHMAFYNLVLPSDDPFWATHYPPNGFGCKCGVQNLSGRELDALQERFAGTEYEIRTEAPPERFYEYTRSDGTVIQVPVGIDPGWDYNPGMVYQEGI